MAFGFLYLVSGIPHMKGLLEVFGGWAITPRGIRKDISIAVENDRIVDMGRTEELRKKHKFSKSVGGKKAIISLTREESA